MRNALKIYLQQIPEIMRELEWTFARSPVWLPLQADGRWGSLPPTTAVNLPCTSRIRSHAYLMIVGSRAAQR
jgi:hypothetical protein